MKLYIWNTPYSVAYGSSLLFVVAPSLKEARRQAKKGTWWKYGDCPENPILPKHFPLLGSPTRVVDLPCAEWHEWSE
jgi:hypothetical protein